MAAKKRKRQGLTEVLGRALVDVGIHDKILNDPESIGKQYGLSDQDLDALKSLGRGDLEDAATRLASHADFKVMVAISGHFDTQ